MTSEEEFNLRLDPTLCQICHGTGMEKDEEWKSWLPCTCPKGLAARAAEEERAKKLLGNFMDRNPDIAKFAKKHLK